MKRCPVATFALLALAFTGCSDDSPRVTWQGTVDTSSTGVVRVANPAAGLWEIGAEPPLELVPELTIGELSGEGPEIFSTIAGLEVAGDGRILVLDRETNELRMFSPAGEHLRSVGRTGQGPGEYTQMNGILRMPSDSLLVVDQEGNRYSILAPEGDYIRTVRRELPFYGWLFEGGLNDGRVYERFRVQSADESIPALFGTDLRDEEAPMDTIPVPVVSGPVYEAFKVETERFGSYLGVPFAPEQVHRLDGEGGLWFGRGDRFRLIHASLAGDTLREVTLAAQPTPVSDEELDEWMEQDFVREFRESGGEIDIARIPDVKPYWDDLVIAPDGKLWVARPSEPNRLSFAVFDPEGRYLGDVGFRGVERVRGLSPIVADGRLHVATQNDLGVQRVHVFGIREETERLESAEEARR